MTTSTTSSSKILKMLTSLRCTIIENLVTVVEFLSRVKSFHFPIALIVCVRCLLLLSPPATICGLFPTVAPFAYSSVLPSVEVVTYFPCQSREALKPPLTATMLLPSCLATAPPCLIFFSSEPLHKSHYFRRTLPPLLRYRCPLHEPPQTRVRASSSSP